MENDLENDPEPTCATCAAWTGEECRLNPPVPLAVGTQVVTVFPRTASTAWCLMHEPADEEQPTDAAAEPLGAQNG